MAEKDPKFRKGAQLYIRLTEADRRLLERAQKIAESETLSAFGRETLLKAAAKIIRDATKTPRPAAYVSDAEDTEKYGPEDD